MWHCHIEEIELETKRSLRFLSHKSLTIQWPYLGNGIELSELKNARANPTFFSAVFSELTRTSNIPILAVRNSARCPLEIASNLPRAGNEF